MSCIRHCLNQYNITYPNFDYNCSWILSRNIINKLKNYKLETVAEYYDISFNHHHALEDAKATATIILKLLEEHDCSNLDDLYTKYEIKHGTIDTNSYRPPHKVYHQINYVNILKPETNNFDESRPFYDKEIIFTGTLNSMPRKDAQQKVLNVGGKIGNGLTMHTNYLVIGELDYSKLNGKTKSSKIIKAEKYIEKGKDLQIINEFEFLRML